MLSKALDWQMIMASKKQLKFPSHLVQTTLRPDLLIYSNSTKKLIIWKLSVAWEEIILLSNERKHEKYQELVKRCQQNGWKT